MSAAAATLDYEYLAASTAAGEPSSVYCGPLSQASKLHYELPLVKYGNAIFRLNGPVEISLYPERDGLWICESELLSSLVHGDTPQDAVLAFFEDFAVLWDQIAKAPDDTLAPDALNIKRILHSLVRAVEQER